MMVECTPIRGVYSKYESMEPAMHMSNEDASALIPYIDSRNGTGIRLSEDYLS